MTSSGENRTEPNNQLIQQLAAGLQSTSALIQGLLREIRENSLTLASFEGELSGLQRTVVSLNRVLQEGDGRESILTRVALLEQEAKAAAGAFSAFLEEQKREAAKAREQLVREREASTALVKQEREDAAALVRQELAGQTKVRLGRLQMVGLITPAVLAFVISLLALLRK